MKNNLVVGSVSMLLLFMAFAPVAVGFASEPASLNSSLRMQYADHPCPLAPKPQSLVQPMCGGGDAGGNNPFLQATWSGFEFYQPATGQPPNFPIYEADASWTVPGISNPGSPNCTSSPYCYFLVWTGLVSGSGGVDKSCSFGGCIVQVGTASVITNSGVSYFAWYEYYPRPLVQCGAVNVGDSVRATVQSQVLSGGNVNVYTVQVYDSILGLTVCNFNQDVISGAGYPIGWTPYYAEYIAERACFGSVTSCTSSHLPQFGTYGTTGSYIYKKDARSAIIVNIYDSCSLFNFNEWIMTNTCGTTSMPNINISPISTSSTFTQTWVSSCGT